MAGFLKFWGVAEPTPSTEPQPDPNDPRAPKGRAPLTKEPRRLASRVFVHRAGGAQPKRVRRPPGRPSVRRALASAQE